MDSRQKRDNSAIRHLLSAIFNARAGERGQALVEYAIVFPLQLMMTLAIIQLAQIFVAKQVLEYAAFCGARAALTGQSDPDDVSVLKAIIIPLSRITGATVLPGTQLPAPISIPGWNNPQNGAFLTGSDVAQLKTVNWAAVQDSDGGTPIMRCDINEYDYELTVPMGNFVASKIGSIFMDPNTFDWTTYGTPHLRMQAHCRLAMPWSQ